MGLKIRQMIRITQVMAGIPKRRELMANMALSGCPPMALNAVAMKEKI